MAGRSGTIAVLALMAVLEKRTDASPAASIALQLSGNLTIRASPSPRWEILPAERWWSG
jgi:hypothetical protein